MPLYFTFTLMLFCFNSVSAARVVLALYALDLGAQPSGVGLLFATYYAFPLVISWPLGRLSDRIGSRWLLVFGAVSGTCGMLIPYFVRDLSALYAAGTMIGLSFACYNVLLQNLVGLLSKPEAHARNFSNMSMLGASSNFLGPLIAGFSIDYSGTAFACLYVVALSLTAVVLLVVWGGILPRGTRSVTAAGSLRDTLSDKEIVRMLATSSLAQVGQDLYQFYIPIYGHAIGLSASAIGSVIAAFAVAQFATRFIMPHLVLRLGEEGLLAYSFYLAAAGFLLVPFFEGAVALGVVSFMFGLGMGCCQPVTTMQLFRRSAEGRSGETLGLRQTVNNVLRVSGPVVFGFVATAFGLVPVFWMNALMMVAGGWIARPVVAQKLD